ncbi:MAG: hypothetical protein NC253_00300 [Ruminococcus sp.]|nr:hypothetical protein [Ruminococcus sp.]MCM1382241.1 hypothetical protein [Muribaculaceae bacterium]MCM1478155.1 hypothetical protein [Muribaculaceae bacterium]
MIELQLLAIFALCTAALVIFGITAVKQAEKNGSEPRIFIVLPAGKNTADIEFLVRSCIYRAAEQYPQAVALLCDYGAEEETVRIFEKLMEGVCEYYVADRENSAENVCKIIKNMV